MAPLHADRQHHPVAVAHKAHRAADVELRVADAITAFAGSMRFVYIHAVVFGFWMLLVEPDPWPKLTLVVSVEAIFLSAFVLIGQNRQSALQVARADHDFITQEQELKTNRGRGELSSLLMPVKGLVGSHHRAEASVWAWRVDRRVRG